MYFCTCVYIYKCLFPFSFKFKISLKPLVLEHPKTGGKESDPFFQYLQGCLCLSIDRSLCLKDTTHRMKMDIQESAKKVI